METIRRHPAIAIGLAFLVLMTLLSTFAIVPETRQAIVVRFGKPDRILNRYQPGEPIGGVGGMVVEVAAPAASPASVRVVFSSLMLVAPSVRAPHGSRDATQAV